MTAHKTKKDNEEAALRRAEEAALKEAEGKMGEATAQATVKVIMAALRALRLEEE